MRAHQLLAAAENPEARGDVASLLHARGPPGTQVRDHDGSSGKRLDFRFHIPADLSCVCLFVCLIKSIRYGLVTC